MSVVAEMKHTRGSKSLERVDILILGIVSAATRFAGRAESGSLTNPAREWWTLLPVVPANFHIGKLYLQSFPWVIKITVLGRS